MNISSNQKREPNLWRPPVPPPARQVAHRATASQRVSQFATWRCTNAACGQWTQPSKADVPGTCNHCGAAR